jgi:hypothetical protein
MADLKISALPASTTPLAGTEVLPIVQSSTTRQVSIANLTAGRAVGATSIQFGSGSVLSSYEEGTWTPIVAAGIGTITSYTSSGLYTKIGRLVSYIIEVSITNNGTGSGDLRVSGMPFSALSANQMSGATRERGFTGQGIVSSSLSSTSIYLTTVTNTYPGGTGYIFTISIIQFI